MTLGLIGRFLALGDCQNLFGRSLLQLASRSLRENIIGG